MNTGDADELAALRARAYGRNADIFDDPAALQRLRELEQRASRAGRIRHPGNADEPAEPVVGDGSGGGVDATPAGEPDLLFALGGFADATPASGADTSPDSRPAGPRPFTRGLAALWAASVVAACAVTGVAVGIVTTHDPVVATLTEAPHLGVPEGMDGLVSPIFTEIDPIRFEDYLGVAVVAWWGAETDDDPEYACVAVLGDSGMSQGGCSGGGFDATAEITVSHDFPAQFRARHESGAVLRLVHTDARVVITAAEPG